MGGEPNVTMSRPACRTRYVRTTYTSPQLRRLVQAGTQHGERRERGCMRGQVGMAWCSAMSRSHRSLSCSCRLGDAILIKIKIWVFFFVLDLVLILALL